MTTAGWIQLLVFLGLIVAVTPLLGGYMAKVWRGGKAPGDRVFAPVERGIYRICGIDPDSEQRWTSYTFSLLAFSAVSLLFVYGFERLQSHLPFNPDHLAARSAPTSRGTPPPASSPTRTGRATAASRR